jgi:hypothetical protein
MHHFLQRRRHVHRRRRVIWLDDVEIHLSRRIKAP